MSRVNKRAMFHIANDYATDVLVLEPAYVVDEIVKEAKRTVKGRRGKFIKVI